MRADANLESRGREPGRRRVLQFRPVAAAASSASTCTQTVYDRFVEGFVELTDAAIVLGNPLDQKTTLGPDGARAPPPSSCARQIAEARAAGCASADRSASASRPTAPARPISRRRCWSTSTTRMRVMTEESFGPVVGIMQVQSRRGGDRADERQPLRPHRLDLDRATRRPPIAHRRSRRDRHLCS